MLTAIPIYEMILQGYVILAYLLCAAINRTDREVVKLIGFCLAFKMILFPLHFDSVILYFAFVLILAFQLYRLKSFKIVHIHYVSAIICLSIVVKISVVGGFIMDHRMSENTYYNLTDTLTVLELFVLGMLGHGRRISRDIYRNDPHFDFKRKNNSNEMVGI